ncbi:MAG TPA: amylo-alpha-1,6-glucosidase [Tenuifilaceae bacterium]|nr:amylo-alpha-1,6-glucosidase [Tenuifilaceae bacterium]HPE18640.1 amylo-alpha-1,6-glucosidase [Tenuifilaceae bacterium]HPJ46078.1 amylo-alpha-1,6-glucosidase [Tenuifilaceae bacterium]HPQ34422.1 amylo-alpha-1,6-glucosidase [Tenuifilaceae bacterium]HRX67818.1 amylo-alpha-1,6-glucosidase [Tenuifilaceae bacterium]
MNYLDFDKNELVNLEYSLNREILSTNRAGGYFSTTIVLCNTRKYHGLMVLPLEQFDGENHVLLSSVDETVVQRGKEFNLGIHRYPGIYEPRGHKYIVDFTYEPTPKVTYRVGGVILEKELLFVHNEEQFMIRYSLVDAHSPTRLRVKPFLAFRNVHKLSKSNLYANKRFKEIANGVKYKLYNGFPYLHMQLNKANEFVPVPDWYYNLEYMEEIKRGYEAHEDLFVPGFFEIPIKKGESIIFSASTVEQNPASLTRKYNAEILRRPQKDTFENCLRNAAQQFIVKQGKQSEIIAGFPWFGRWGRDTFIALPGLTLSVDDPKSCKAVLDTMSAELKGGLFPNVGKAKVAAFNSVDAPLWYFWAIQMYVNFTNDKKESWTAYGKKMKAILNGYREGLAFNIKMHENGLIWAGEKGHALTWMDAVVFGRPVTPRIGYAVEINALWYNAIMFTVELAKANNDSKFVKEWEPLAKRVCESFKQTFWFEKKQYLADYVDEQGQDVAVRPNQIFAASLPYSPISDDMKVGVIDVIERELLTPKGLRTLAPKNPLYHGKYEGDQPTRDSAYHQGTVWPWLMGHFVDAYYKLHGKRANSIAKNLLNSIEEDMCKYGICSVAEVYDGDPPHRPAGAISQAWSVAEILRVKRLYEQNL